MHGSVYLISSICTHILPYNYMIVKFVGCIFVSSDNFIVVLILAIVDNY